MKHRFVTLDVFTSRRFAGNPLAVVFDAEDLDGARMQALAREFNLSETVFLLRARRTDAARRLRIFTPGREVPFAGHPTVGTACLLALRGDVPVAEGKASFVLEEEVGPIPVEVDVRSGAIAFARFAAAQRPERIGEPPPAAALAEVLSLAADDVVTGAERPEVWSCGLPFTLVPVRDFEALARARLDPAAYERILAPTKAPQLYFFCRDDASPGTRIRSRMFAPAAGILEDPATGSAAAAVAGWLAARSPARDGTMPWTIVQGVEMGRPSELLLDVEVVGGEAVAVKVGGEAVIVSAGEIETALE